MNKKILVVEDDFCFIKVVHKYLEYNGFDVLLSQNGKEAISILEDNNVNLIITDLEMPFMDGFKFIEYVRNNPKFDNTPILVISSRDDISSKLNCFKKGIDDYLSKPFSFEEFNFRLMLLIEKAEKINQKNINDNLIINNKNFTVKIGDKIVSFTQMEIDIISYLYNHEDQYVNSRKILEEVFNYPPGVGGLGTVRTHIKNIRSKLEEDPKKPEILKTINKKGYFLDFNVGAS